MSVNIYMIYTEFMYMYTVESCINFISAMGGGGGGGDHEHCLLATKLWSRVPDYQACMR